MGKREPFPEREGPVSKPIIAPPVQFSGHEGGGSVYTVVNDQRVTTHIVGRDLTRFLSVTIPNMEKADLVDIQHTIMCHLEHLERKANGSQG